MKRFRYSTTYYRRKKHKKLDSMLQHEPSSSDDFKNADHNLRASYEEEEDVKIRGCTSNCSSTRSSPRSLLSESISLETTDEFSEHFEVTHPEDIGTKIKNFLPMWATKNQIPHTPALNELLAGLTSCGILGLPKDARTLLGTPKNVKTNKMGDGEFWYNGIQNSLQDVTKYMSEPIYHLKLNFNIDGLPTCKSSQSQFWPILMSIANIPEYPCQIIAIYYGKSKPPSVFEFLQEFAEELNNIIRSGFEANGINIPTGINAFICDTPARSFIKCVVGFNAYHGCIKCTVVGLYCKDERRMSFPQTNCPLRTDEDFRAKSDHNHHQKNQNGEYIISPLELLPMDLLKDIVIADSLHLLDLGITKKLLQLWIHGKKNLQVKFFANQIKEISSWLVKCNERLPTEIHRSVRPLCSIAFWKGTEFRTFLFYLGPVILKEHLSGELYRHFLLFFCAVFLCSSFHYTEKHELANQMFLDFIEGFVSYYGIDSITSNVHNLCHIVDDVKRFGSLPKINAYPFENMLGIIKKFLRSGNRPLSQVVNRLAELKKNIKPPIDSKPMFSLKLEVTGNCEKPAGIEHCFKKVILKNGVIFSSHNEKNIWLLTKDNKVIRVVCIYLENSEVVIFGLQIKKQVDFFEYPFRSSFINIYQAQMQYSKNVHIKTCDIKCKLVSLEYRNQIVFIPLIHTLDLFQC